MGEKLQGNEVSKAMEIRQKNIEETVKIFYSLISCLRHLFSKFTKLEFVAILQSEEKDFSGISATIIDRRQTDWVNGSVCCRHESNASR